jgi:hypothetical protein
MPALYLITFGKFSFKTLAVISVQPVEGGRLPAALHPDPLRQCNNVARLEKRHCRRAKAGRMIIMDMHLTLVDCQRSSYADRHRQ